MSSPATPAARARMKIGPDNLLYVLQWSGNGTVKRYELDGTPRGDFTSVGVSQSIGLDWDAIGNLYVSSFNQAVVRKFDGQGLDQGIFISTNLQGPTNIWFDSNGDLLVSDWSGGAIRRFDASGGFLSNYITGLSQPEGMDTLPNGNLLIGNGGAGSVRVFDAGGNSLGNFVAPGAGGLMQPNAVVVRQISTVSGISINPGFNDAWFNPDTPGQGFLITVFPDIQQLFLAWFTFDTERPMENTASLGESGHRWLTAQGSYSEDTANLTIFVTSGGIFNAGQPPAVTDPAGDGTMTITFSDCSRGFVSYEITSLGVSGQIPIQRLAPDNAELCQSLHTRHGRTGVKP